MVVFQPSEDLKLVLSAAQLGLSIPASSDLNDFPGVHCWLRGRICRGRSQNLVDMSIGTMAEMVQMFEGIVLVDRNADRIRLSELIENDLRLNLIQEARWA